MMDEAVSSDNSMVLQRCIRRIVVIVRWFINDRSMTKQWISSGRLCEVGIYAGVLNRDLDLRRRKLAKKGGYRESSTHPRQRKECEKM